VYFPTTFSATAFTMRYGRWAAKVRNATGGVDVDCDGVRNLGDLKKPNEEKSSAQGAASNTFDAKVGPDGRTGPIIGLRSTARQAALAAFVGGGANGLCAALALAATILHETLHLCETDTNPDCDPAVKLCCWQEQRMITSVFAWAMAQRYDCLSMEPNCHAGDPAQFANSGTNPYSQVWG
jgi:hypothetical protein